MKLILDMQLFNKDIIVEELDKLCWWGLFEFNNKKESQVEREINWFKYRVIISSRKKTDRSSIQSPVNHSETLTRKRGSSDRNVSA